MSIHKANGYWLGAILLVAVLLRIPYLDQFPPSLYSDEVSQGYNAYSLIKTGRDEYGIAWPVSFRSFGDWKPPLQTYVMIPSIFIFGLNPYGVRLSAALFGILAVLLMYNFSQELISSSLINTAGFIKEKKNLIALISASFLAISPWHIAQSRMAMLTSIALFFLLGGMVAFLKGLRDSRFWLAAVVSFCLSIYSYYGMRLIVPLLILGLFVFFQDRIMEQSRKYKHIVVSVVLIAIILLLPLFIAYLKDSDVVFGRVKTVSIFHDRGVALKVWELISQDGIKASPWLAQFFHNKPYHYMLEITRRFFEHLDGRFLFLAGDTHPPFQIPGMGTIYMIDLLFLIIGCIFIIKREQKLFKLLLWLIFISILPAALTYVTPSANRTLSLVIPFSFITSYAVVYLYFQFKKNYWQKFTLICCIGAYVLNFGYFLYQYAAVLPRFHSDWWHYGYKELAQYLNKEAKNYAGVNISGNLSVPYIFFLFYNQVDPYFAQTQVDRDYHDDEYGFEFVNRFSSFEFIRYFSWREQKDRLLPGSMLVVKAEEPVGESAREINSFLYPDGKAAFKIYVLDNDIVSNNE